MTGNIAVVAGDGDTKAAFKKCHPFIRAVVHLNDKHVDTAENLDLIMNLYNLIDYSVNYSDTTASLYQYKRAEQPRDNYNDLVNVTINNSSSFKYKSNLMDTTSTAIDTDTNPDIPAAHRLWENIKIAVPLKYITNFFRSLELPLINTQLYIELNWTKHSIMTDADDNNASGFQITKTELYVPVITSNTQNNKKLSDLLRKGFKRLVFWNEYKSKIRRERSTANDQNTSKRILLDASYQGVSRLFVVGFDTKINANQTNVQNKYFLPRIDIKKMQ